MSKTKLEEMDVLDDFLMNALATDKRNRKDFFRLLLSTLLQRKIGKIRLAAQSIIPANEPKMRGIRMDVEVEEFKPTTQAEEIGTIYDIEPHRRNDIKLTHHNRFYQAKIDGRRMKSGEKDFAKLPNLYVITILDYDPFGYDYMMYTVRNHCEEVPELRYEDGLCFVYFYTKGTKGGNQEIRELLKYLESSTQENAVNDTLRRMHDYVEQVKLQAEVREGFMTLGDYIDREVEEAMEERLKEVAEKAEKAAKEAAKKAAEKAAKEAEYETTRAVSVQYILELLEGYGDVPIDLKTRIESQTEMPVLKKWFKIAAKAGSVEEFCRQAEMD